MHKTMISVKPAKEIQASTSTNPYIYTYIGCLSARLNPSFPVLWTHTVDIYEHVYIGLKPGYISDTPKTIKRWFYNWLEQRIWELYSIKSISRLELLF